MEEFVGRVLHVPRAVFANYIDQGASEEPPNGDFWLGVVKAVHPTRREPFICDITVLEKEEDEDELVEAQETHKFSLAQLRSFIVLRGDEEQSTIGAPPATLPARKRASVVDKRKASDVFGTPDGTR